MATTFQYTINDYIEAGRLHLKTPLNKNYLFWAVLIAACLSAAIWSTFWYFPLVWIAVEIALNIIQNYVLVPLSIKHQLKQNTKLFLSDTTIKQTDDTLSFESPRGYVNAQWTDILRWKHNEHYLLIYMTSRLYYCIPKRLQEQQFDIHELIEKLNNTVGKPSP